MNRSLVPLISTCLLLAAGLAPLTARAAVDEGRARYVPWSGFYWPVRDGQLIRGPLGKYDLISGRRAAYWEYQNNPPHPEAPPWHGYCHAWAAAAVLEPEPLRPIAVRSAAGSVPLEIGDQKGLLTACHTDDVAQHYGVRFTGERPGEDRHDIYPVYLWRVLKLYISERGVPIIVDTEAGKEVWNYPVFAYRVEHRPGPNNRYLAQMSLLMADDEVPPNFVGVRLMKKTYYFTFQMVEGSAVLGSGRWAGPSERDHPDFAWYPQIIRSENPEVNYKHVKRMVDRAGNGPAREDEPQTQPDERADEAAAAAAALTPPAERTPEADGRTRPYLLSPVEVLRLVANRKSSFPVDVTVDRFDGGQYEQGEPFGIAGTSAREGYLHLFYLGPHGDLALLYPTPGNDNHIEAQKRFLLPPREGGEPFRALGAPGTYRVKAVVTQTPLRFSGLTGRLQPDEVAGRRLRLPPSTRDVLKATLEDYQASRLGEKEEQHAAAIRQILGEFGQDEVAFYVGPARENE